VKASKNLPKFNDLCTDQEKRDLTYIHNVDEKLPSQVVKSSSEIVLSEAAGQDKKEKAQTVKINSSLALYQNP
jgi:hypothetical protein